MGFVLIQWCIVLWVCLGWGLIADVLLRYAVPRSAGSSGPPLLLLGWISVCWLAQWLSCALPLDEVVLCGFVLSAGLGFLWRGKGLKGYLKMPALNRLFYAKAVCTLLLVGIALLKCVGPSEIDDETGYHLPLIRWIEDYPLVPGIANIEDRMGFDSVFHLCSALFSLRGLWPGGLYDLNGLLFVVTGLFFLQGAFRLLPARREGLRASDLLCALALVFPFRAYLTSTDADFSNLMLGLVLLISLLRYLEEEKEGPGFAFWGFCLAFLISIKASSGLLILPLLACWWQKDHRRSDAWQFSLALAIGLLPWLLRNVFISGYLVYPMYYVDLFEVDWKVPHSLARGQLEYIGDYARLMITQPFNTYHKLSPPLAVWLPDWLRYNGSLLIGKVSIAGLLFGLPLWLWTEWKQPVRMRPFMGLWRALWLCCILWFGFFPAIRIGWAWILATLALGIFLLIASRHLQRRASKMFLALALLGVLRASWVSVGDYRRSDSDWRHPNLVASPQPLEKIQWDSIILGVAPYNFCGGHAAPCLPRHFHPGLQARGTSVEEGFRIQNRERQ